MSTPDGRPDTTGLREMSDRDAVAALIGEHSWDMTDEIKVDGVWTWVLCCECGEMPPMAEGHQHIADGILVSDWLATVKAQAAREALREAADDMDRLNHGDHRPPEPYLPAGTSGAVDWLRDRANGPRR